MALDPRRAAVVGFVCRLLAGPWFNVRVRARAADVASVVEASLAEAGLADRPERRLLAEDAAVLGELLAAAAGCEEVSVRVEQDPGAMCPVFHQDNNLMRLLCTYAGPDTEWLPEKRLDRSQLGLQGRTPAEANAANAGGEPNRSDPGEVLIVKGARFDAGDAGLVHKSPSPALGPRLLVAIDPIDDLPPARMDDGDHGSPGGRGVEGGFDAAAPLGRSRRWLRRAGRPRGRRARGGRGRADGAHRVHLAEPHEFGRGGGRFSGRSWRSSRVADRSSHACVLAGERALPCSH